MKDRSLPTFVKKLGKRLACLASLFLKPITIFKWTGVFPFRQFSCQETFLIPYKYEDQAPLGLVYPRSIYPNATWTPNPLSTVVMSHRLEVEDGFASRDGYVFDKVGKLIRQGTHKYRDKVKRAHTLYPHQFLRNIRSFNSEVAIVTASNQHFYWHWLFDILPRLLMLVDLGEKPEKFYIQQKFSFQRETLKMLNLVSDEDILDCDQIPIISASRIVVPCHQIASGREFPKWVGQVLRERFLSRISDTQNTASRRIYVSRKAARFRRILNECEIIELLEQYGFISVMMENLTFVEQVNIFRNADIVVGASGGGLANLVFCPSGTKVIELFPSSTADANFRLSRTLNLDYYFLTDPDSKLGLCGYDDYFVNNIRIDPNELRDTLHLAGISA